MFYLGIGERIKLGVFSGTVTAGIGIATEGATWYHDKENETILCNILGKNNVALFERNTNS